MKEPEELELDLEEEKAENREEVQRPVARPVQRLTVEMPKNADKMRYIETGLEEWFAEQGISGKKAKQKVIIEMAIDMLYAKPEIEEKIGKDEVALLMAQKVKRFM